MNNGNFLRLAVPLSQFGANLDSNWMYLSLGLGVLAIILALFAYFQSQVLRRDLKALSTGVKNIVSGQEYIPNSFGRLSFVPVVSALRDLASVFQHSANEMLAQKAQLEAVLDSLHEGILVLDSAGMIKNINTGLKKIFTDREHILNQPVIALITLPELQETIDKTLAGDENCNTIFTFEHENRILEINIYDPGQEFENVRMVIIVRDVTKQVTLERAQRNFVANVSHELRTPLTSIKGYAETLVNAKYNEEQAINFATKIYKNSEHLTSIIEDLLSLARVDNYDVAVAFSEINPLNSVHMAAHLLLDSSEFAQRLVITEPTTPLSVWSNEALLLQAVRNLMENALRYAPENTKVEIAVHEHEERIWISVSDNGLGIAKAEQERIFERFYRVEKQRSSSSTGLGLSISKQIIERLGGALWVETPSPVANTTFYISLPKKNC